MIGPAERFPRGGKGYTADDRFRGGQRGGFYEFVFEQPTLTCIVESFWTKHFWEYIFINIGYYVSQTLPQLFSE